MEIRRYEDTQVNERTMTVATRERVEIQMSLREAIQLVVDLANLADKAGVPLVMPPDNLGSLSVARILYRLVGATCRAEIEKLVAGVTELPVDQYGGVEIEKSRIEEINIPPS